MSTTAKKAESHTEEVERSAFKAVLDKIKGLIEIKKAHGLPIFIDMHIIPGIEMCMGDPIFSYILGYRWEIYEQTMTQRRAWIFFTKKVSVKNVVFSARLYNDGASPLTVACYLYEKSIYEDAKKLLKEFSEKYNIQVSLAKEFAD